MSFGSFCFLETNFLGDDSAQGGARPCPKKVNNTPLLEKLGLFVMIVVREGLAHDSYAKLTRAQTRRHNNVREFVMLEVIVRKYFHVSN